MKKEDSVIGKFLINNLKIKQIKFKGGKNNG